jgi:asparagine synthase (glutamine-hydrolysing)
MCAITGLIDLHGREINRENISVMTHAVSHRGPDGNGVWFRNNIALGHCRLAIVDLSQAANQPMKTNSERYILTYNGEIYNYLEIRKDLEKKGYQFKSNSDTEVVLNSLIEWGTEAILKFNGIFAFGFYDALTGSLLIARDRYGVKPVYYSECDQFFAFASEQKSILKLNRTSKELDVETLYEYMTFQNIFTDKTVVKNIKLLQPGHFLQISTKDNNTPKIVQYWDFSFKEIEDKSESEYVEEFKEIFKKSVYSQMMGDVEVGAYLSGGIDSSSIVAIASTKRQMKTFTVGFDSNQWIDENAAFDERVNAQKIAGLLGSKHYEHVLKPSDIEECIKDLVRHVEEPRLGQSYPNYFAAKLASENVKVVLSGAGGDELFGGYPWRYFQPKNQSDFSEYIDKYYLYWQRLLPNSELKTLFEPVSNAVSNVWTRDIFQSVFKNIKSQPQTQEEYVNYSLYFEAKTFLHSLLILEDKISMSFGLESRIPFLDNNVVDFAMKLPVKYKIKNLGNDIRIDENITSNKKEEFIRRTNDGKQLLRQALPELVPSFVKNEIKRGFTSPDLIWFRNENRRFIEEKILNRKNSMYDVISFKHTKKLANLYFNGKSNNRLLIWSLIYLKYLLDEF